MSDKCSTTYETVCRNQIEKLDKRMEHVEKETHEIREKIFDGLLDDVRELKSGYRWLLGILVGFLITALLGIAMVFVQQRSIREEIIEHRTVEAIKQSRMVDEE